MAEQMATATLDEMLRLPLRDMDLSVRAENALAYAGLETVGDLVIQTERFLLGTKGFGKTCLMEVRKRLAAWGLSLGMQLNEDNDGLGAGEATMTNYGFRFEIGQWCEVAGVSSKTLDIDVLSRALRRSEQFRWVVVYRLLEECTEGVYRFYGCRGVTRDGKVTTDLIRLTEQELVASRAFSDDPVEHKQTIQDDVRK